MKILLVSRDDIGGIGRVCLDLMKALQAMGHECRMVVLRKYTQTEGIERYGYWQWRIAKMPSELLVRYGFKVTRRNKARALGGQLPTSVVNLLHCRWIEWADIVHLHHINDYVDFPSFFRGVGSKPLVWTLNDESLFYGLAAFEGNRHPNHPLEQHYAEVKRRAVAQARNLTFVPVSEYLMQKFNDHELFRGRDIRVINNTADTNLYHPIPKTEARQRLGISEEDTLIAFSAFIASDPRKGLDKLSEAVSRIGDPHMKIVAVGKNIHHRSWPNVIEMGFKDTAESLCEVFSACDIFAMPSMQEAFALTPMQAMACGLPVVAFPVSGTSELINDANGVICRDYTVDSLVEGLKTIMSRKYDANAIRQDMKNRFSPTIIAQKYIKIYKSLL